MIAMMADGWTSAEERAFGRIMRAGLLERLPAIRLYRRCESSELKALNIARRPSDAEIQRRNVQSERMRIRNEANHAKVVEIVS